MPARRDPDATRRLWADRLDRFRKSGLTVARFCAREGVSEPSFYSWRRALERDRPTGRPAPAVVPIRLTPGPHATGAIELAFPSGAVLRFPPDTRPELIAAVLCAAEGRTC